MDYLGLEDIKKKIKSTQLSAIKVIEEYLYAEDVNHQALIKMPTGSGKTGIIAIVSNFYEKYKNILILVPNSVLPEQIEAEIWSDFWCNIRMDRNRLKIKKVAVYKVKDFTVPMKNEGIVIITTIQSLVQIFKKHEEKYLELKEVIDLVIFDEGHREPSLIWSKAIRGLCKKTILFTATPYRNDDALFSLHESNYKYNLSFNKAVRKDIIKDICFKDIEDDIMNSDEKFCELILGLFKDMKEQKILIRCSNGNMVKNLTENINAAFCKKYKTSEYIALGCHSTFGTSNIPYLVENGEKVYKYIDNFHVFVHEDMLIEGINIPEIDILIMYGNFENTRSLIQQIGRIVRKNKFDGKAIVYVRKKYSDKYNSQWSKFLKHEDEIETNCSEETVSYYDKEFKEIFILNNNFYEELLLPKSSIIYEYTNIEFIKIIESLKENLLNKSNINRFYEYSEDNLWIMCYEKLSYSNLTKTKLYKEVTLECMLLKTVSKSGRGFLLYYDSWGYGLPFKELGEHLKSVNIEKILSLFPNRETNFNQVKLNSINISNIGVYGTVIEGNNIQSVNTNINEKLSFCKFAKASIEEADKRINRYIGTTNSKVIDNERVSVTDYCTWADDIITQLLGNNENNYFSRFALPINVKDNIEPTSILIDFSDISDKYNDYEVINIEQVRNIESICTTCSNNSFIFEFNNNSYTGQIEKSGLGKSTRFRLNIPIFRTEYYIKNRYGKVSLEHFINREQCFRIFFNEDGIIYSDGYFFKPNIKFTNYDLDADELGKRIFVIDGLQCCKEEKFGAEPTKSIKLDTWPNDSVFGCFIDALLNKKGPFLNMDIDYLICDDLDVEIADFIAICEKSNKVILAHCKHKESIVSASSFQDLCGQAVKNVGFVIKNNIDLINVDNHIDRWTNGEWSRIKKYNEKGSKKSKTVKIKRKRIIKDDFITGKEFWEKYKSILKSPDSRVEVWLVIDGLSRSSLKDELLKNNPEEQIKQLMWILYCTQEVIAEVGGTLKVFCKE